MNRTLRARHRAWTTSLAVLVPVVFAAAIFARPEWGATEMRGWWPDASGAGAADLAAAGASRTWRQGALELDLTLAAGPDPAQRTLTLRPVRDARLPDVLVYSSARAELEDALPGDALFLGTLAGAEPRAFHVPAAPAVASIYFYSLAHRELVGATRVPE